MMWNWQLPDWPNFRWDESVLAQAERAFVHEAGIIAGIRTHLDPDIAQEIVIGMLSDDALASFAIEGEVLERSSVQSSLRRAFGIQTSEKLLARENAVAEIAVDVYRNFSSKLSDATLFRWHARFMEGRSDLESRGKYRSHDDAMQIVSGGNPLKPKVHFEAPPSSTVEGEMIRFIDWFNGMTPGASAPLASLTRAGIAHLYFECIHPFEDGNGRIGRAISDLALAQSIGAPVVSMLSATLLKNRRQYYEMLAAANTNNEITPWLRWFGTIVLNSQQQVLLQLEYVVQKTAFLNRHVALVNERQKRVLLRMLREGPSGFIGGLSAAKYRGITGASSATATRDLAALVHRGALQRTGALRHRRYGLNMSSKPALVVTIDEAGKLEYQESPEA